MLVLMFAFNVDYCSQYGYQYIYRYKYLHPYTGTDIKIRISVSSFCLYWPIPFGGIDAQFCICIYINIYNSTRMYSHRLFVYMNETKFLVSILV